MSTHKSYYAIIPANIRYNDSLTANAKLLYGEITALCNEKGYCWASNKYFATLYNVSSVSISKWISSLENEGYIKCELIYKPGTKEIDYRKIIINHNNDNTQLFSSNVDNSKLNNNPDNTSKFNDEVSNIIKYLNSKINSRYRSTTGITVKLIKAKLNAGYTVDDFKLVIDNKYNDWFNTEFEKYLRPSTLFGPKFEQYLNQKCSRCEPMLDTSTINNDKKLAKDDNGDIIIF